MELYTLSELCKENTDGYFKALYISDVYDSFWEYEQADLLEQLNYDFSNELGKLFEFDASDIEFTKVSDYDILLDDISRPILEYFYNNLELEIKNMKGGNKRKIKRHVKLLKWTLQYALNGGVDMTILFDNRSYFNVNNRFGREYQGDAIINIWESTCQREYNRIREMLENIFNNKMQLFAELVGEYESRERDINDIQDYLDINDDYLEYLDEYGHLFDLYGEHKGDIIDGKYYRLDGTEMEIIE